MYRINEKAPFGLHNLDQRIATANCSAGGQRLPFAMGVALGPVTVGELIQSMPVLGTAFCRSAPSPSGSGRIKASFVDCQASRIRDHADLGSRIGQCRPIHPHHPAVGLTFCSLAVSKAVAPEPAASGRSSTVVEHAGDVPLAIADLDLRGAPRRQPDVFSAISLAVASPMRKP